MAKRILSIIMAGIWAMSASIPKMRGSEPPSGMAWGYDKQISDAIKTHTIDGETYIIAAEHYDYAGVSAAHLHPTAITSYIIDEPIRIGTGMGLAGMKAILLSLETRITRFTYNSIGRVIRVDFPGDAYITYTWTLDGKYIASKSINADDNKIKYEWLDMVGLSRMQDATGRSETYRYDSKNRLMQRRDTNGNPTEEYHYHLKNE